MSRADSCGWGFLGPHSGAYLDVRAGAIVVGEAGCVEKGVRRRQVGHGAGTLIEG